MNNFTCKRCGQCCGVVPFNKTEYKAVRRTAEKLGVSLVKQYIRGIPHYVPRALLRRMEHEQVKDLAKSGKLECPFLEKNNDGKSLCQIYELRPAICRIFGTRSDIDPRLNCPNQKEKEKII